jgi:hypothetical protein
MTIPSQLEILKPCLFYDCKTWSLTQLNFEVPSRLKQLDLPWTEFGSLCIPDSVEIVTGIIGMLQVRNRVLRFGRESRLSEIHLRSDLTQCVVRDAGETAFFNLSEGTLRRLRCKFESL